MPENAYILGRCANDALPLEYKLQNRHPLRQVDVGHFINNPSLFGVQGTDESGIEKKSLDVSSRELGVAD